MKRRVQFGCAGQKYSRKTTGDNSPAKPMPTYGLDVFEKCDQDFTAEECDNVRAMVADILDSMQRCENHIELEKLKNPPPFNFSLRYQEYAMPLAQALRCTCFKREDVQMQSLCFTRGECCLGHTDAKNCGWRRYTKTATGCFFLWDAFGDGWSFKINTNSRNAIGSYYDELFRLKPMLTRIERNRNALDYSLQDMDLEYEGPLHPDCNLSSSSFKDLFLDDTRSWETVAIGGGGNTNLPVVYMDRLQLNACPVRDMFLSAPATVVHRYKRMLYRESPDPKRVIRLCLLAGYTTGFHRFYYIGDKYLMNLLCDDVDTFVLFPKLTMKEFGVLFGDKQVGRISPTNLTYAKFCRVFLQAHEEDKANEMCDTMVDEVYQLLLWINDHIDDDSFCAAVIEKRFQDACEKWACMETDFSEFRLMIVVQILVLAGVVVRDHPRLNDLVYPVAKLGAAEQLQHIQPEDRPLIHNRIMSEFNTEDCGESGVEGTLCESSDSRVTNIYDYFFRGPKTGQDIFTFSPTGQRLRKPYGSNQYLVVECNDHSTHLYDTCNIDDEEDHDESSVSDPVSDKRDKDHDESCDDDLSDTRDIDDTRRSIANEKLQKDGGFARYVLNSTW